MKKKKKENNSRKSVIAFIRANHKFYQFVDFSGHNLEQLKKIKDRIETSNKI
jgi:hypothetical protein